MTLGDAIKAARLEAGMSQAELSEAAGISQNQISLWENGKSNPSPGSLDKLSDVLNIVDDGDLDMGGPQDVPEVTEEWTKDAPPKARAAKKTGAHAKGSAAKPKQLSLAKQLEFPYMLLSQAAAGQMPATSKVLAQQAPVCAAAWDQFLLRYPALREKIEQGAIAGDIVVLIMAHMPIVQVAREEMAFRQAQAAAAQGYDGGINQAA